MKLRTALIGIVLLGLMAAAGTIRPARARVIGPSSSGADEAAIRRILDNHLAWTRAKDWQSIRAEFTDDAVVMPNFRPAITGGENIGAWFKENFDQEAAQQLTSETTGELDEVRVFGDWAFDRGRLDVVFTAKNGKRVRYEIRILEIFRKQPDGSWKIVRAMNNLASAPSSGAK